MWLHKLCRLCLFLIFISFKITILHADNSQVFNGTVFTADNNKLSQARNSHQWDILIFTQSWPPTVCEEWKKKNASHSCSLPNTKDSWSIHGIWPTKIGTIGPVFCNRSWHFDQEKIRPIETTLMQEWINVENGTPLYSLWAHEWVKHGTCAALLEPLNSELKYFSKGLEWIKDFNIYDILKASDILPSNDKLYSVIDISNAIKKKLGVNPVIECWRSNNAVSEIRICFDKSLKLVNCNGIRTNVVLVGDDTVLTNCDYVKGVLYSDYIGPIKKILVHLYRLVSWLQWVTL